MILRILTCFSFMVATVIYGLIQAQPNDHCSGAWKIPNVPGWCSTPAQFTNTGAVSSGIENPGCFPAFTSDSDNDVWFTFKAIASMANIRVIGAIAGTPGGTLKQPQFGIYHGSCTRPRLIHCISDAYNNHIAETFAGPLTVGDTYFIRVDGRNNQTGTFQLCINQFNPVPNPSSDCATAVVLCDKSSFTVPSVSNAGNHKKELPPGLCLPEESQSVWYKWTCETPGTLTFTLRPNKASDDLDFALFLLPGGIHDCSGKISLRCMASGENVGRPFANWKKCTGATGLRTGSTDYYENEGCEDADDNFLAPVFMEAGKSYALLVNNYHRTGNGFSIEFGGTGTFVGPSANFTLSKLKVEPDQPIIIKDASSFGGEIKKWEWNFGANANPTKASGKGPHSVSYSSTGKKSVSLTIETDKGCKVTKIRELEVTSPPQKETASLAEKNKPVEEKKTENKPATLPTDFAIPTPANNALAAEKNTPPTMITESEEKIQGLSETDTLVPTDSTLRLVEHAIRYEAYIYFQSDSFTLKKQDEETLYKVLDLMVKNPGWTAIVEGHTNNIPSDEYCQKLGQARADAVIQWLQRHGIQDHRLIRHVYGKKKVVTKDYSLQNRVKNQRVVILLKEKMK